MTWDDEIDRIRWNDIDRDWRESAGRLRRRWSKLTEADIAEIQEKRELLSGKLEERYGMNAGEARRAMGDWLGHRAAGTSSGAGYAGLPTHKLPAGRFEPP